MNINKSLILFFVLILTATVSVAANKVVHYQPGVVSLEGKIIMKTFPGLPNYESIKKGDEPEKGAYLKLFYPVDVKPVSKIDDDFNVPEKNVRVIQIVDSNANHWKKYKEGNRLRLTGTLFHAHTGHHHSQVLITVKEIKEI